MKTLILMLGILFSVAVQSQIHFKEVIYYETDSLGAEYDLYKVVLDSGTISYYQNKEIDSKYLFKIASSTSDTGVVVMYYHPSKNTEFKTFYSQDFGLKIVLDPYDTSLLLYYDYNKGKNYYNSVIMFETEPLYGYK